MSWGPQLVHGRVLLICVFIVFFFFPFFRARFFRTADARRKMPGGAQHSNRLDDWQIPALSTWQMSWWDEL